MRAHGHAAPAIAFGLVCLVGCEKPRHFTTTVEVLKAEALEDERRQTSVVALELRYAECPGDARRILRGDREFAACAGPLKTGDSMKAEFVSAWQAEKGTYRNSLVKLGNCAFRQDANEEANYEVVNTCTDVVTSDVVVGMHCDRTRSKELVDRCPWLRRK